MSCCGKKRNEYTGTMASGPTVYIHTPPGQLWNDVFFEYTGETGLTLQGSITGRKYRFNAKGDKLEVDYRDAGGMMAIPVLKKCDRVQ